MDSWGVVFLGVIALSSLVQAAFLVSLALGVRRVSQRVDELRERLDREVRPALEQFSRISRNLAEISDLGVLQARRVDDLVEDTIDKIEQTTAVLRNFIVRPLGPVSDIVAFLKGLRKGILVYRSLSGFDEGRAARARSFEDDEHLFI